MDKIKVSVIIPIYNVENYLRECLDSIINQTLKEIEIICINDGSKDNSGSIIQEYASKDSRITLINKENGGYASAINSGLDIAKGKFIQIVESDDFCDICMLEEMYNKIQNTDAELITSDFYFVKGNKKKISRYLSAQDANIKSFCLKSLPYIIAKQAYPWKSMYRSSFLNDNNIRMLQDDKGAYEDQPWNATILALATKILYLNKPLYYYRLDANGSSTNCGGQKMINYIYRKAQTAQILKEKGLYYDNIKEYFADSAVGGCLFFFKRISFNFKEEYYNNMKEFLTLLKNEKLTLKFFSKKNKKLFKAILEKNYRSFYKYEILKHSITKLFRRSN